MFDRRRWARHGQSGALFFLVVFLACCLVGYDPGDPPGAGAEPANDPPSNPCGPVGASIAHALMVTVGRASYLILFALAVANLAVVRRRKVAEPGLRLVGFGLLVAVASALSASSTRPTSRARPSGPAGTSARRPSAFLEGQFGPAGMFLILSAPVVVGLALCHDILFLWPIQEAIALVRRRVADRSLGQPRSRDLAPDARRGPGLRPADAPTRTAPGRPASRPGNPRRPAIAPPAKPESPAYERPVDGSYLFPPIELFDPASPFPVQEHQAKIHARALLLEKTFLEFGCQVRVVQIDTGPVITQFEIELEAGLRVAKINSVANDLAIALAVPSVRIVSPIPNKTTVGIEVPNDRRTMVRLVEVVEGVKDQMPKLRIPLFLGKDVKGTPLGLRPLRHAAPADRRPDGDGQVGLPERDDPLDPDDQAARRGQADPDRPQDRRADAVQEDPAPDEPGRHRR